MAPRQPSPAVLTGSNVARSASLGAAATNPASASAQKVQATAVAVPAVVNAGSGIGTVLPQLAVLLAFAGLFFTLAIFRFRRVLVGAA